MFFFKNNILTLKRILHYLHCYCKQAWSALTQLEAIYLQLVRCRLFQTLQWLSGAVYRSCPFLLDRPTGRQVR